MNQLLNTTSNFHISQNSNSDEISYPQALPLSSKEITNLKWTNIASAVICVALWCKALVDIPQWYDGILAGFTHAQASITSMILFFLIIVVCLVCFVVTVGITYLIIKSGFEDSKGGIKHAGIVELISKKMELGSESTNTSYYVMFKWTNNTAEDILQIDHSELYRKLAKGNRVYIELLPNSKKVLSYRMV